ncbi:hypothetical protein BO86DRAFT_78636 [Aspergillus japonicus CBS 114.51]|uniref:Transmembrane protein n=2 Tax=Aspergillus TaxID=5052 RepID=A0A2V5HH41_ASPV1|nr:hypothetical protein BO86DRAFT_78636 [Aspergillus japonicus CBS 114.51]PYI20623.1 hypothetical protein BO99DRAFT_109238 [Aspergillus violaceofuscus CBS 115571]RAH87118.1 hypothetical protein BO86DRAFT_78636 [Aspergillus japonicus CBS 114.51]
MKREEFTHDVCLLTSVPLASFSDLRAGLISRERKLRGQVVSSLSSPLFLFSVFLLFASFILDCIPLGSNIPLPPLCLRFLFKHASASFPPLTYPSSYVCSIFGVYIVPPFHLSIYFCFFPSIYSSIYLCLLFFMILSCAREISTSLHCLGSLLEQSPRVICTV